MPRCRVCVSDNVFPVKSTPTITDHETGLEFGLSQCAECSSAFVQNAPEGAELASHYLAQGGSKMRSEPSRFFSWARSRFMLRELRSIERQVNLQRPLRILEIGTGDGSLVSIAHSLGHNVTASDLFPVEDWNHTEIAYLQFSPGCALEDVFGDLVPFDVVIMRHVLEHVPDPPAVITSLACMGVKYLVITVPNWSSPFRRFLGNYWYYLDPPRHLSQFTRHSFQVLADKSTWRLISVRRVGIDELVTSLYRYLSIKSSSRLTDSIVNWVGPTSILAGASSVIAKLFRTAALTVVLENTSKR